MQKVMTVKAAEHEFGHLPPGAAGLGRIAARPKIVAVACVILLAAFGWLYLAWMLAVTPATSGVPVTIVQTICSALAEGSLTIASVAIVVSMWTAMTLAMMLPSASPMILTYAGIAETAARKGERIVSPFVLTSGYISVWLGFSLVAALAQIGLMQTALRDASVTSAGGLFSGAIFIAAGVYQFSALKHACLTKCQHPFPFFFANWATTPRGVFRLGQRQGIYCLGCCWALMLVMFAIGAMNVIWMAALGAVMTIEKMLTGRRFTYAIGALLIVIGIGLVVTAFGAHWPVQAR